MQVAQGKEREATEEVNARVENDHDNLPSSFFFFCKQAQLWEKHMYQLPEKAKQLHNSSTDITR